MSQQHRTILIVDDSPEDRELYRRYLLRDREFSYTLVEATLGQQGLKLWQQHQPDAVLLDYRLPDLDGLEFLTQLQPLTQQLGVPVIVVTGQGNEAIAVQVMKAGAQDYLIKGQITPERLQIAVNGVIETVRLRRQLQLQFEQQRLVMEMTQCIRRSLNLEDILQTTVDEVRQFLRCDRVIVFQFFPDWSGTAVVESVSADWMAILSTNISDCCFGENYVEPFKQGLITAKTDIYNAGIDPCHVELLASFQVKANLVVPILNRDELWGLLIAHHCAAPRKWESSEIDLLRQLGAQVSIAIQQAALFQQVQVANEQLENLVLVDQLTQIANRRCFDNKLDSIWQYFLRKQGFVSLLLCDIDYFKQYNDTYGHAVGDTSLTIIAQALKQTVKRSTDLAARYGGEEFVVILPSTDSNGAAQVAQEIHRAIQELNIPHTASAVKQHVTISIGIATLIPSYDMLPLDLIKAADQALYQAKAEGRNRSCINLLSHTVSNVRSLY